MSAPIAANTTNYTYDSLGRLTSVETVGGSTSAYDFDLLGNRTNVRSSKVVVPDWSFEEPNVGNSFQFYPTASGIVFNDQSGIVANGGCCGFPDAPNGTQVAFIDGSPSRGGALTETISGLTIGQSYIVTFQAVNGSGYLSTALTVTLNGFSIGTFTPVSIFQSYSTATFVASAQTASLSFSVPGTPANSEADSVVGVDSVIIIAQ